ncbi:DUF397 domain-containing protein [Labedaea rhizosphaerae]|uniref:Uncharacterized protein DUF397 n=1 Tax=Labedaea rhizosphaerae TaxID=598644 RepID=A0A4R6SKN2_LABRH|nr:DUF397 domain-containing protein [Labedaea rhizosphaerae]TDQ04110.1 uncharacterized protein DUF397 [Labedaea rhizosphaerae]
MKEANTLSTVDFSGLAWRKSSRSTANGDNGECVEIAFTHDWRKSSRSTANGDNGNCVEIAFTGPVVAVRDSKNPEATPLAIPATAFTNFLRSV